MILCGNEKNLPASRKRHRIPGRRGIRRTLSSVKVLRDFCLAFVPGDFPNERLTAKLRQSPEWGQCARRMYRRRDTALFPFAKTSRGLTAAFGRSQCEAMALGAA